MFNLFKKGKLDTCPNCGSKRITLISKEKDNNGNFVSKYRCENCGKEFAQK